MSKNMEKIIASLLLLSLCTIGHAERLFLPFLPRECQSNIIVTAELEHPKPCPPEFTNLISNTNFFTPAEQERIEKTPLKYKNVTTNAGPTGTVFKGIELREWKVKNPRLLTLTFSISCFVYTNSNAQEEINFEGPRQIFVNFRTQRGNGYNLNLIDGKLATYQEYKNGVLDGLHFGEVFDKEHCNSWTRFEKGKIIGKFLGWNEAGQIDMEAGFNEPFDLAKCVFGRFDLTWEKVPATQTNSALNAP
jgi:hypothetical protein